MLLVVVLLHKFCVKTQRAGAAELVWRSRDQDTASTCVLRSHTGTRLLVISGGQSERVSGMRCGVDGET